MELGINTSLQETFCSISFLMTQCWWGGENWFPMGQLSVCIFSRYSISSYIQRCASQFNWNVRLRCPVSVGVGVWMSSGMRGHLVQDTCLPCALSCLGEALASSDLELKWKVWKFYYLFSLIFLKCVSNRFISMFIIIRSILGIQKFGEVFVTRNML